MSRKKVMDDLDALLADLQSTTSHIQQHQQSLNDAQSSEGTPPPLPPYPAQENVYELQRAVGVENEPSRAPPANHSTTTIVTKVSPQRSSLSNNLSELDTLLQDLSSAQFMAEIDRRDPTNSSGVGSGSQGGGEDVITPQTHTPRHSQREVDDLLDQLDRSDGSVNHYEQVNVASMGPTPPRKPPHTLHSQPQPGASTATRELDDLMASLSEFKVDEGESTGHPARIPNPQSTTPAVPSPSAQQFHHSPAAQQHAHLQHQQQQPELSYQQQNGIHNSHIDGGGGNNLDAMLGNLSTDMSKQGVTTVPKGHCAACSKPIIGQVITALGHIWHPEHFICSHCKGELGTQNFFERDGIPFCERDYHMLFSPRCASCNGPILDKCITALDKSWHPEHFVCAYCGRPFGEDGFHERDGMAYCREDYFSMFAPRCGGCDQPIMENYITALNKQWHPECFVCYECRSGFGSASFFDHDGFPFCETHYHAKRGSLCAGCQKPISGRCITAMYKKFHPEHFVCAFCIKQLNQGTFKEQNDKPYCHPCFIKLFG